MPTERMPVLHFVDNRPDGQSGSGTETVVLIHGVGDQLGAWDPLVPWLTPDFRVVAYDLRGHGQSEVRRGPYRLSDMVADYANLLDRLEVDSAHVVGQSLGGMIAQAIAIEAPDRVNKLVILSAIAGRNPAQQTSVRARLELLREHGPEEMARRSIDRWYSKETQEADPGLAERVIAQFARNDRASYTAAYEMFAESDLVDDLHRIKARTLVGTGEGDEGSSPEMAHRMAELIPNADAVIFEGVQHAIFEGDSKPVCRTIRDFLKNDAA